MIDHLLHRQPRGVLVRLHRFEEIHPRGSWVSDQDLPEFSLKLKNKQTNTKKPHGFSTSQSGLPYFNLVFTSFAARLRVIHLKHTRAHSMNFLSKKKNKKKGSLTFPLSSLSLSISLFFFFFFTLYKTTLKMLVKVKRCYILSHYKLVRDQRTSRDGNAPGPSILSSSLHTFPTNLVREKRKY